MDTEPPPRRRSPRTFGLGLAVIVLSFVIQGLIMGADSPSRVLEPVFYAAYLAGIAGWAIAGAAFRPRGSPKMGAVLGIVAYFGVGLAIFLPLSLAGAWTPVPRLESLLLAVLSTGTRRPVIARVTVEPAPASSNGASSMTCHSPASFTAKDTRQ